MLEDAVPRVLVIDDSPDIHRLLDARLRTEGVALVHATDPLAGVELARRAPPDLILLDVDMPATNGLSVCRMLKADPATSAVPIIFLSAVAGVFDKVAAFDAGGVDYIVKPFDVAELRARVRASIRTKRFQDMLALRAQIDGLTGLRNRTYFDARFDEELGKARRYHREFCVAMVDIDHFKRVNDTFGHPTGDRMLAHVAQVVARELRTTDAACRYGGEEFGLLLPETALEDAATAMERLREAVVRSPLARGGDALAVTVSVGVAGTSMFGSADAIARDPLLAGADDALYVAKRRGRNRVFVHSPVARNEQSPRPLATHRG